MGRFTDTLVGVALLWSAVWSGGAYATEVADQLAAAVRPPLPQPPHPAQQPPPPPTSSEALPELEGSMAPLMDPDPLSMDTAGRINPRTGDVREDLNDYQKEEPRRHKRNAPDDSGVEGTVTDKSEAEEEKEEEEEKSEDKSSTPPPKISKTDTESTGSNDHPDRSGSAAPGARLTSFSDVVRSNTPMDLDQDATNDASKFKVPHGPEDRPPTPGYGGVPLPAWLMALVEKVEEPEGEDAGRIMEYFNREGGWDEYESITPFIAKKYVTEFYSNLAGQIWTLLKKRSNLNPALDHQEARSQSQPQPLSSRPKTPEGPTSEITSGTANMNLQSSTASEIDESPRRLVIAEEEALQELDDDIILADPQDEFAEDAETQPESSLDRVIRLQNEGNASEALIQQARESVAAAKADAAAAQSGRPDLSDSPPSLGSPADAEAPGTSGEATSTKKGKKQKLQPPKKKEDRRCMINHRDDSRTKLNNKRAAFYNGYTPTAWPSKEASDEKFQPATGQLVGGLTNQFGDLAQENIPGPLHITLEKATKAMWDRVSTLCRFFRSLNASYNQTSPVVKSDETPTQAPLHPHYINSTRCFCNYKANHMAEPERFVSIFQALTYMAAVWMNTEQKFLDRILGFRLGSDDEYLAMLAVWATVFLAQYGDRHSEEGRRATALMESGMLQEELMLIVRYRAHTEGVIREALLSPSLQDRYLVFQAATGMEAGNRPMSILERYLFAGPKPSARQCELRNFGNNYNWYALILMDCRDRLVWENYCSHTPGAMINFYPLMARQHLPRRPLEGPLFKDVSLVRPNAQHQRNGASASAGQGAASAAQAPVQNASQPAGAPAQMGPPNTPTGPPYANFIGSAAQGYWIPSAHASMPQDPNNCPGPEFLWVKNWLPGARTPGYWIHASQIGRPQDPLHPPSPDHVWAPTYPLPSPAATAQLAAPAASNPLPYPQYGPNSLMNQMVPQHTTYFTNNNNTGATGYQRGGGRPYRGGGGPANRGRYFHGNRSGAPTGTGRNGATGYDNDNNNQDPRQAEASGRDGRTEESASNGLERRAVRDVPAGRNDRHDESSGSSGSDNNVHQRLGQAPDFRFQHSRQRRRADGNGGNGPRRPQ